MKRLVLVIIITIIVGLLLFRSSRSEGLAIEGLASDEAIKNIASVYNTDKMTISNLNVTTALSTPKLNLGTKWILTGSGKDTLGYDDEWLRFVDAKGAYYGGIAAGKFYDVSAGGQLSTVIAGLQNRISALESQVNSCMNGNRCVMVGSAYHLSKSDDSYMWGRPVTIGL